jgi:hypothetical protein
MQPVFQLLLGLQGMSALLLPEVIVTIAGLVSLWVIWTLREPPEQAAVAVGVPAPGEPPLAAEAQSDLLDLEG